MSFSRKKVFLAIGGAIMVGLAGVVFANRQETRLRLAYPPGEVTVARDIVYIAGSTNPKHRLDVYGPKDARGAPVVHFVHGGYWVEGDKDFYAFVTGLYGSVGQALARRGIVTVVQSYRLSPEVAIDGIVDDVMAGLKWTQTHVGEHGGDPKRIFMMGHSAGGHLVALIGADDSLHQMRGLDPHAVSGYVVLSGIWDIAGMHEAHDAAFNARVTYPVFGKDQEKWAPRSPLTKLHAGMSPFLVVVGEHDFPFMIPQAARAREQIAHLESPVRTLTVPGADHAGVALSFGAAGEVLSDAVASFVGAR